MMRKTTLPKSAIRRWAIALHLLPQQLGCLALGVVACLTSGIDGYAQVQQTVQANTAAEPQLPAKMKRRLDQLQAALKAARAVGNNRAQAKALNSIGTFYSEVSQYSKALDSYNEALIQARAANDKQLEAAALNGIAVCYLYQNENDKALEISQQALELATASRDVGAQAAALDGLGWVSANTGLNQKALEYRSRALLLARQAGNRDLDATILRGIGIVYTYLSDLQKALGYEKQALSISRATGNRNGEAQALTSIAIVYLRLGDSQEALDYNRQALSIFRAVGDRDGEAQARTGIAGVYLRSGESQEALDSVNRALSIYRAVGARDGEAQALTSIASVYMRSGELQEALDFANQALPIYRAVGDRDSEAQALMGIGYVYSDLGEQQKALDFDKQALPILRAVGDRDGEAQALGSMGMLYYNLGELQKALDYDDQALPMLRAVGDRAEEASTLNNTGAAYYSLRDMLKTLECYKQALPILRAAGDRTGEASTLNNIGAVYYTLGANQIALSYYSQALAVDTSVNDPLREAVTFHNLLRICQIQQPALAIFYGKQAVNLLQQVRGNMQGLDKELQQSFISSKDDNYRDLASLLIDQGRLPEAQQVLDLLKQQEYTDYVRGNPTKMLSALSLTPAEQQAEEDYQKSTAKLVTETERWSELKRNKARTPEEEREFQQLSNHVSNADKGLDAYYSRLYKLFGEGSAANRQKADVRGDVSNLNHLIENMPHVVALYTTVTQERYSVIVISGSATVAREYAITEKELSQKVAAFQQVLRDPSKDPKPLAQELYKILVGPVKSDLDQAQAQTLAWSLDGVLRYIPMAALYDGEHYLVENYNNVTFTHASIPYLSERPDMGHVSAVAMGISRKYEDDLDPLPKVANELDEIVKDPQVPNADGVLPGSILLNSQFTEKAMENELDGQYPIVHIASHFVFKPGDDNASYLLLAGKDSAGAGYHLTVADFNANRNLGLDNTDLLTLSACETGMSGNARNGEEIDGLGDVAQNKGAKAVISSLWEVNDASTGELMADFYKRWADGSGKVMKVEALREAQLDLLQGKINPVPNDADPNAPTSFAHPYYWAPFVLMGNWR